MIEKEKQELKTEILNEIQNVLVKAQFDAFQRGMENVMEHNEPSEKTKAWVEQLRASAVENCSNNQKLMVAIFGDPDDEKSIGMKNQVEEMYKVFTSSAWIIKLGVKIFAGLGILAGALLSIIKFFKEVHKN